MIFIDYAKNKNEHFVDYFQHKKTVTNIDAFHLENYRYCNLKLEDDEESKIVGNLFFRD